MCELAGICGSSNHPIRCRTGCRWSGELGDVHCDCSVRARMNERTINRYITWTHITSTHHTFHGNEVVPTVTRILRVRPHKVYKQSAEFNLSVRAWCSSLTDEELDVCVTDIKQHMPRLWEQHHRASDAAWAPEWHLEWHHFCACRFLD